MIKYLYKPNNNTPNYNFVMAYPEKYAFALSSLGFMWLYMIADRMNGICAKIIDRENFNLPFLKTDSIAFSLSFDFDFMGVFEILDKNNIPLLSSNRSEEMPLVFAGGHVITTNPVPYLKIFDFLIIGDGEDIFETVLKILAQKKSKKEILMELSNIEGIYVPHISKTAVKHTAKLENVIYTPILSDDSYFKDTFIIEIQRGCSNCCAFCTASYLNLPVRSYNYEKIIDAIEIGLKHTNKIALLGAQVTSHPKFSNIVAYISDKMEVNNNITFSISSLRVDAITPELVRLLVKGGQKTSTIAIEAASERLRKLINKNISKNQIFNAVQICKENGLKGLKIYSMIGIPTETKEDINEFIMLANELKHQNQGFKITFSFSSFVPKPHTPFQWQKRENTKSLERKQHFLGKELAKLGIEAKFSSIKWDFWQSVLSRGSSELTDFMIEVYKNGGNNNAYKIAAKKCNIDLDDITNEISTDKKLPWDCIKINPCKNNLINELNRLAVT